jgi:hypothetical protein
MEKLRDTDASVLQEQLVPDVKQILMTVGQILASIMEHALISSMGSDVLALLDIPDQPVLLILMNASWEMFVEMELHASTRTEVSNVSVLQDIMRKIVDEIETTACRVPA